MLKNTENSIITTSNTPKITLSDEFETTDLKNGQEKLSVQNVLSPATKSRTPIPPSRSIRIVEICRRFGLALVTIFLAGGYGVIYESTSWRVFHLRRFGEVYHFGLNKYCDWVYKQKFCINKMNDWKSKTVGKTCEPILRHCGKIEKPTVPWKTKNVSLKIENRNRELDAEERKRHSSQVIGYALKLPKMCMPSACILTL